MTDTLSNSRVVVTGAGGSLGQAIADDLRNAGAKVAGLDLSGDGLISGDLTNEADTERCITEAAEMLGGIDVLINNAGLILSKPLVNIMAPAGEKRHALADWHQVVDANLTSTFLTTGCVVEHMLGQRIKGTVINISSVSAGGTAGQSAYSAAKAGVEALTKVWAKELGPMGLRFAAIAPGYIDTPSTRAAMPEDRLKQIKGQTALRRLGSTDDICRTVRYIIETPYVTGQVISVDGGLAP